MRKRFEQQTVLGRLLIEDTEITLKCRHSLVELMAALKEIFINNEYNEKVFNILEKHIMSNKKKTGRRGMDLWQIFVLSQVRLCGNCSYDELHYLANHDKLIRQIMGAEHESGFEDIKFEYQHIYDNVNLLSDEVLREINEVIVFFGHNVFKKKETAASLLKTDTFVLKSNVHFPTDYNLLWDSTRKCLDAVEKTMNEHKHLKGWRKIKDWRAEIKSLMREVGRASSCGGKNKEKRLTAATKKYLTKSNVLAIKLEKALESFPADTLTDVRNINTIEHFLQYVKKHIDLVERRIIKGEQIPHEEKIFSVFETYTEMIKKGKLFPNVELGKKVAITTDEYHLIVDYRILSKEQDRDILEDLVQQITSSMKVESWSFDKGFWSKENMELLKSCVPFPVISKLGKLTKQEELLEKSRKFTKLKNKHSAIESNINELEQRGLDVCPDKGFPNFKRYVGLAVSAYNLKKIGKFILAKAREEQMLRIAS